MRSGPAGRGEGFERGGGRARRRIRVEGRAGGESRRQACETLMPEKRDEKCVKLLIFAIPLYR